MDTYGWLKTAHILGAILFLGNITVTAWWKFAADRSQDHRIIAFAQRQIGVTDLVFTLGGSALVTATGYIAAFLQDIPLSSPWIVLSSVLYFGSGILWLTILIPLQAVLERMAADFVHGAPIPLRFHRLERLWIGVGILAILMPMATLPLMVQKPGSSAIFQENH